VAPDGRRRRRDPLSGRRELAEAPFYAEHHVDEVVLVDPAEHTVSWLALRKGGYEHVQRSGLIDLGPAELAEQLDWPE
jgi:hypothetical protein